MKKPVKLLTSKYRKDLWEKVVPNLKKMTKSLSVEEVYVQGSFSSNKRRPADVDFVVLLKTKTKQKNENWSFDVIVAPNNKHGQLVFEDVRKWMQQKYGKKNFEITKIK